MPQYRQWFDVTPGPRLILALVVLEVAIILTGIAHPVRGAEVTAQPYAKGGVVFKEGPITVINSGSKGEKVLLSYERNGMKPSATPVHIGQPYLVLGTPFFIIVRDVGPDEQIKAMVVRPPPLIYTTLKRKLDAEANRARASPPPNGPGNTRGR